jgi:hypothetical protein
LGSCSLNVCSLAQAPAPSPASSNPNSKKKEKVFLDQQKQLCLGNCQKFKFSDSNPDLQNQEL